MAAPIFWAPGIIWFFPLENPHAHKIPPFRGGLGVSWNGGVEVPILYLFARYRGHLGSPGPKLEKESKNEFPGPLGPRAQKVENGVEKESK